MESEEKKEEAEEEGEKKEKGETIKQKLRNNGKIFPKYGEKLQFRHLKTQRTQCRVDTNKTISRHIRVKLMKTKDKKRILKAARKKVIHSIQRGSLLTYQKQGDNSSNVLTVWVVGADNMS